MGSQTKSPNFLENGSQTEGPEVIEIESQTESPKVMESESQTESPNVMDNSINTENIPPSNSSIVEHSDEHDELNGLSLDFVCDISIPDGSTMTPGESFTKIWRLLNTGNTSLPSNCKLVFLEGESMFGPMIMDLPEVEAGQQFDVTMELTAPNEEGEYEGCWSITSIDSKTKDDLSDEVPQMTLWVRILVKAIEEYGDDDSWSVIERDLADSDESESEKDHNEVTE